ncbi:unnamed protein product [Protopolystoma xenopodis]|uniref:Uncharacterized protein n=1 Tax=Protopolystoma xenopodis TaxID=117903 RepID=A0A3S5FHA6_9PLAT|nr:unnamed protein product [Protopolystoma xenopodis]
MSSFWRSLTGPMGEWARSLGRGRDGQSSASMRRASSRKALSPRPWPADSVVVNADGLSIRVTSGGGEGHGDGDLEADAEADADGDAEPDGDGDSDGNGNGCADWLGLMGQTLGKREPASDWPSFEVAVCAFSAIDLLLQTSRSAGTGV